MEMKFNLELVNWLASVADPTISFSKLGYGRNEKAMIQLFLTKLTGAGFSSIEESPHVLDSMNILLNRLTSDKEEQVFDDCYTEIRQYLVKKQWIALIIPSGLDQSMDNTLCDRELLGYLVKASSNNRGVILQLEQAPEAKMSLLDVHGVIRTALNKAIKWPGILIWSPGGDSVLLPINSVGCLEIDIEARLQWTFSKLFSDPLFDLGRLKVEYKNEFPEVFENEDKIVNIIHLSDLGIGNDNSSFRMARVQQHIRELVEELGQVSKIVPVITGNFMDNPSEKHINKVASFWEFLRGMGTEEPLLVFGNHDVRQDGNINENYHKIVTINNNQITWYEVENIAFISLNTVMYGNLEQGIVGKDQIDSIEYEIRRKEDSSDYKFVILMHHLPIAHQAIDKPVKSFYDRSVAESVTNNETIKDSELLFEFVDKYDVTVLLHGHQSIPLVSQTDKNTMVVGCGNSIGNNSEFDGNVYFSINVVSINSFSQVLSSRLLAIRKPEAGFIEAKRHEVISRLLI